MAKLTKKTKSPAGQVDSTKLYAFADAMADRQGSATAKFDESIDVAVQLGIDAKKSDQVVRGAVVLPNGTGKTTRVAVFAQGAKAEEAKAAGADIVGMDDLAAMVKAGDMPFDVVIAAPDAMRVVGTLGQILGPRGLMPNPKVGTVTPDVATAVKNAKAGQVQFRVDKAGIVHSTIGRRSFDNDKLQGNLAALIDALNKAKPATSKGVYLRKVAVSSTMGVASAWIHRPSQRNRKKSSGRPRVGLMWWAGAASGAAGHPRPLVCATLSRLKPDKAPTQMAIPLQMEIFLNSWSLQQERARGVILPSAHFKE
jgi:large subunit ribosomal protein L1